MSDLLKENSDLFIVYRYNVHSINNTKFIMGIYDTQEKAIKRQYELAPNYNKPMCSNVSADGNVVFINKLKLGDSNIEMFTTNI